MKYNGNIITIGSAKIIRRAVTFLCLLLCFCIKTFAQKTTLDSLQVMEDGRKLNVYALTNNIVYLPMLQPTVGFAKINMQQSAGNFIQPMQAQKATQINATTGGLKKVNNWMVNAVFNYKKQYEKNVAWSAVHNAYDDNPFIWADSSVGDWERDEVQATIGIIAPTIKRKWSTGLQIDYTIGSGARRTDPKPFFRYKNIALQPAITYQINNANAIGLTGNISFVKEENEMGFYQNANNNVLLYRLRGYGTFSKAPFVNGERKRVEKNLMARLHYTKAWKNLALIIATHIAQRDDEIIEGVALPTDNGFFTLIEVGGSAVLYKGSAENGKSLKLQTFSKNGYADDVIFRAESASSIQQQVQLDASTWCYNEAKKRLWQFSFSPSFIFIDNTDQATFTQFTTSTVKLLAAATYRKKIKERISLFTSLKGGYNFVVDKYFDNRIATTITKELIAPNYNFLSTNYVMALTKIGVDVQQKNGKLTHGLYATLQSNMAATTYSNRTNIGLTYSILF